MSYEGFLRYSGATFITAGLALLLFPKEWFPSFYQPAFMGWVALTSPFISYLPEIFVKAATPKKKRAVLKIRVIITISLLLGGIGELGLYQLHRIGFEYDKFAHFTISLLLTYVCAESVITWKNHFFRKFPWSIPLAVLVAGILWEVLEAVSDMILGTQVWGVYGSAVASDTLWDIFFDTFGILAGMLAFAMRKSNRRARTDTKPHLFRMNGQPRTTPGHDVIYCKK